MSAINDGGPAFPIPITGCNDGGVYNTLEQSQGRLGGMSLRDYFAAKVMAALISDPQLYAESREEVAQLSYQMADEMIAAREGGAK